MWHVMHAYCLNSRCLLLVRLCSSVYHLLTGILMLNLVCRNSELRQSVLSTLKMVFRQVCSVKVPEDVNEAVYCFPSTSTHACDSSDVGSVHLPSAEHLQSVLRTSQQQHKRSSASDVQSLVSKLDNLKWL